MIAFDCFVGALDPAFPVPDLMLDGQTVTDYFTKGSRLQPGAGPGDILLRIDRSRAQDLEPLSGAVGALDLHMALARLTRNPTTAGPVRNIGVVFANTYHPAPEALGVMFDLGAPADDAPGVTAEQRAVPREGCAVFLGAIAGLPRDDEGRTVERVYTTIHELGHVFNLGHADHGRSFMRVSELDHAYSAPFGFDDDDRKWLSQCSASPVMVQPGGSPYRFPNGENAPVAKGKRRPQDPVLRIGTSRSEVYAFEPFELEIRLSAPPASKRRVSIPNEIDPGYDRFAIWVEAPDGSRRRYRSPRIYCTNPKRLVLGQRDPFERDVSIFWESGGYTFSQVGTYRIWATLALSSRKILSSNVRSMESKRIDAEGRRLLPLSHPSRRAILYHRAASPGSSALRDLMQIVRERPKAPTTGMIAYAIGRALQRDIKRHPRDASRRMSHDAATYLSRAIDHRHVGDHARKIARQRLDALRGY